MEASKVTVSLHSPLLTRQRKQELRLEALTAWLDKRPYGKRVKAKDIKEVCHFKTNGAANQYLNEVVKRGEIIRHEIGPRSFFYTVAKPVRVTLPVQADITALKAEAEVQESNDVDPQDFEPTPIEASVTDIESKAMKYLWYHGNDLRGFVKQLKSQGDI